MDILIRIRNGNNEVILVFQGITATIHTLTSLLNSILSQHNVMCSALQTEKTSKITELTIKVDWISRTVYVRFSTVS